MNICTNCKHMRRGRAIDRRKAEPGYPARGPRIGLRGGDHVCAALPIIAGKVDPQTGAQDMPSGEDCRDLNPTGECSTYAQGSAEVGGFVWVLIVCALAIVFTVLVTL